MAKLKARGRTELARVSKEVTCPDLVTCNGCEGTGKRTRGLSMNKGMPNEHIFFNVGDVCDDCKGTGKKKPLTMWQRTTRALMSDGNILEKYDVRFQPDVYDPKGKLHTYGWKVRGKGKAGLTAESFIELYVKAGYKKE